MSAEATPALVWAPLAWLPDGWHERVLLRAGADGRWAEVTGDVAVAPSEARVVAGPLLPGVVDAHSHAFQRAFAGASERRDAAHDDFWSWRERMYAVALRIGPDALRAIAAQLYVELLRGGYTHVCEFHYLRRDVDGSDYADPLAMSWALADAAADAGIGVTILPVLYERAAFDAPLRDEQRRFRSDARTTFDAAERIRAAARPLTGAGLAIHSLRAARAESIAALRALADGFAGPIHIHVAEQTGEVDECLRATGRRPLEWLAREGVLDPRWQLVHATHATADEIGAVAAQRRRRRRLPEHRSQPRRRRVRPARLARRRRSARDRLRQPGDARLARGAAPARVRAAARAPCAQRRGCAGARRRVDCRAAVRAHARRMRRRRRASLRGGSSPARAPTRWSSIRAPTRCSAWTRGARSTRSSSAARPGPWRDVMVAGRWVLRDGRHAAARSIAKRYAALDLGA